MAWTAPGSAWNPLCFLLCVFDGTRPLDDNDRAVARGAEKKTAIALLNKSDLLSGSPGLTGEDWALLRRCFSGW